jgi:hypothetical protein
MMDSHWGVREVSGIELTNLKFSTLILTNERRQVKEIIADMMDSHGGLGKPQV